MLLNFLAQFGLLGCFPVPLWGLSLPLTTLFGPFVIVEMGLAPRLLLFHLFSSKKEEKKNKESETGKKSENRNVWSRA
jgi:hypothetical protein